MDHEPDEMGFRILQQPDELRLETCVVTGQRISGISKAHNGVQLNSQLGQWTPISRTTNDVVPSVFMLTTDVALLLDTSYRRIVESWSNEQGIDSLNQVFASAWYKMTTRRFTTKNSASTHLSCRRHGTDKSLSGRQRATSATVSRASSSAA